MYKLLHIAKGSVIAILDLLQLVVVGQIEQSPLHNVHLLHFADDIFPDAVHYFLVDKMYACNGLCL